ncbi:MAG: TetR family transcriptional regulator, partial [Gordonia sp. (in: high G+C Gram-positive bacteria)]
GRGRDDDAAVRAHYAIVMGMIDEVAANTRPAGAGLRERARVQRRRAMVEAALALFADRGYQKVTVADICADAQVSPRTFFRYFATKDDLLAEPAKEMYDELVRAIADAPDELDAPQTMGFALTELGEYVLENRARLVTFFRVIAENEIGRSQAFSRFFDIEHDLARILAARHAHTPTPSPDWQTRVIVGRGLAAYRVWLDDLIGLEPGQRPTPLDEILRYTA